MMKRKTDVLGYALGSIMTWSLIEISAVAGFHLAIKLFSIFKKIRTI
jgi:hypothetical protein